MDLLAGGEAHACAAIWTGAQAVAQLHNAAARSCVKGPGGDVAQMAAYLTLDAGVFAERVALARELLSPCRLCPRECGVRRLEGERGYCRAGATARVASCGPHFGEEPPLVGRAGSGTIFFSHCNLRCCFCQNYDIAHGGAGEDVSAAKLAEMMLRLQELGCHNLNFVTPTHFMPQILEALEQAVGLGVRLPVVYNCGGYESVEALRLLDGIVDIYMPDAKFMDGAVARRLCNAPDYPERMQAALREMHRQVGDLEIGRDGLARRGLLVRHLVMPHGQASTPQVAQFLASLSPDTYVNLMDQYRPCYRASNDPLIARYPTAAEYAEAVASAQGAGLHRFAR